MGQRRLATRPCARPAGRARIGREPAGGRCNARRGGRTRRARASGRRSARARRDPARAAAGRRAARDGAGLPVLVEQPRRGPRPPPPLSARGAARAGLRRRLRDHALLLRDGIDPSRGDRGSSRRAVAGGVRARRRAATFPCRVRSTTCSPTWWASADTWSPSWCCPSASRSWRWPGNHRPRAGARPRSASGRRAELTQTGPGGSGAGSGTDRERPSGRRPRAASSR